VTGEGVTLGLAALAGAASFLSPCVLALVPAYLGYLGGRSTSAALVGPRARWPTFLHGLAFVGGFSLLFIAFGAAASAVGALLYDLRPILAKVGGVVVVVFGLHTLGVIHIPLLDMDTRPALRPDRRRGYLASAMMGVFFSAGWSPCVGPVLGVVLTLAANRGQVREGMILLTAYSAGMALPFLLAALGVGGITDWMRTHPRLVRAISLLTGAMMVVLGVMLITGTFELLARLGFFVNLGL
jgi:cytochrome c-type biogenesis protein